CCEACERRRARNRELGQAFAVERDAGVLETVDELAVGEAVLARRGIDSNDPESAEIALLAPPADKGILQCCVDRLFGGTIQLALVGVVAFRQIEQLLAFRPANRPSLDTRHFSISLAFVHDASAPASEPTAESREPRAESLRVRQHAGKLRGIGVRHGRCSSKPAPPLGGLAAQQVLFESLAAQKLPALCSLEACGRAAITLDLLLRH